MVTFYFFVLFLLSCGFLFASKVTPYDNEDYTCPSKAKPHTNEQDRNDKSNTL